MSELNDRILECVRTSGLADYDRRSAIGIARTWVEKRKPFKRSEIDGYEKRDALAASLVQIMEEIPSEPKQYAAALQKARKEINRPFHDPTMLGAQVKHLELLKPKDGGN